MTDQFRAAMANSVIDGLVASARAAGNRGSIQLRTLGEAISAGAVPEATRVRVHTDLGQAIQRSTINAYTHRQNRRPKDSYRSGTDPKLTRYAGGMLLQALRNDDFFEATANGLKFINTTRLNQKARQWRRLNFGAGSAGGGQPGQFPIDFLGVSIGLTPDRRPGFDLPPGYWLNGENQAVSAGSGRSDKFYSRGAASGHQFSGQAYSRKPIRTKGIQATNFLDAGVRRFARDFGTDYFAMYRDFYNSAIGKAHFNGIQVNAPRPRLSRF